MASGSASPPAFLSISFISFVLRVSTKSCCPSLPSPFAAFFLRPAQIACFGLEVQETQKTAQQEKTGKMREEKQDTLPIIFILLCSLLGSASRVQVAVAPLYLHFLRCERFGPMYERENNGSCDGLLYSRCRPGLPPGARIRLGQSQNPAYNYQVCSRRDALRSSPSSDTL